MTETDIQNKVRVELSNYGIVVRENTGNFELKDGRRIVCGVKGLSDLLFIGYGYVAFIEMKKPGQKATEDQERFIEKVRSLGHIAGVAHSVEEALEIIRINQEPSDLTAEQIDSLARKRELLPDNAGLAARNLYHSLVMLYKEYRDGIIDADSARKEKTNLFAQYGIAELHERIWKEQARRMVEISKVMVEINKSGCPLCQQVARLFDGRQHCADVGADKNADD